MTLSSILSLRPVIALLLLPYLVVATFDCKLSLPSAGKNKKDIRFDLSSLGGERTAAKETSTPPTTSEARIRMKLCGDEGLPLDDSLSEEDQVREIRCVLTDAEPKD